MGASALLLRLLCILFFCRFLLVLLFAFESLLRDLDRPVLLSISPGTNVAFSLVGAFSLTDCTEFLLATIGKVTLSIPSRDFSSANLIGAKGLHGRSWPDLDMLPLGWLTDPGNAIFSALKDSFC
ncbi:hypothetical protein BHE74_00028096 [Ensete ventricosum]|nr:hypothetical protein BHE74_00028096 [Ensete ventricosum]